MAIPKLPKQAQLALMIGIPVAVCGVLCWFILQELQILGPDKGLKPSFAMQKGDAKSLHAQINKLQADLAALRKEAEAEPQVEKDYQAALAIKKEAEDMLPRAAEKGELSQRIEELARQVPSSIGKVDLKSVTLVQAAEPRGRAPGANAGPQSTILKAELTGDLNSIIAFIDSIEKNTRFMQVNSASIRSGSVGESKDGRIGFTPHSASIEIVTYIYSPPAARRSEEE